MGAATLVVTSANPASADLIRLAMLPVSINTSLSETEHLSAGLADMISARLEQSGQILVLRVDARAGDREEAIEAGKQAGADYVLFGSYTQFGDGASLDLRCAPVAGAKSEVPRRVFIQAGSAGEIIPKLEVLAESVTRYLVGESAPAGAADAAGGPGAPDAGSLLALEQRIEALERVIFAPPATSEPAAAEPAAAEPAESEPAESAPATE